MPVVTQILKYGVGHLSTMNVAFLQRWPYLPAFPMPGSDRYPHCHQPDSGGHIMRGCGHRVMKSLYISRHPLDSPLEGHLLWDLALITPGSARSYLFYLVSFFWRPVSMSSQWEPVRNCAMIFQTCLLFICWMYGSEA